MFFTFFFSSFYLFSQNTPRSVFVKHINEKIVLDGVLDEPIWQKADKADDFWQFFPRDSVKTTTKTEVKMLYDDKMIYVGIRAEAKGDNFVITSLRRDFGGPTNDNVSIVFDTFNDGNYAFVFSANAYGVQREALIVNGGANREDFNPTWDVKWFSEGTRDANSYTLEFAIPFSSLKFKEGSQKWRFQSYRFDLQTNEQSAWARIPQNLLLANLGMLGEINFEKPLGKSKAPIYAIPYINTIAGNDFAAKKPFKNFTLGGDAKIAIGNTMNLDLTYNPDFSNVEVDNIITNLTRFEISLPEKRQFFIDNNDLFGNYGNTFSEARPFFSRRIGIVTDTLGNTIENKIIGGLRLSGKLDKNWRLGVLNMQTAEDLNNRIASNNNAMISLQRKVFARSNIGAFMINRQTFQDYDFLKAKDKFNRVVGIDYNLASKNSAWIGRFYAHKSLQPDDSEGNISAQAVLFYNSRYWNFVTDWTYIDKEFKADLGFVPRTDIVKSGNYAARTFYYKNGKVNKQKLQILNIAVYKPTLNNKKVDHLLSFTNDIEFKDHATMTLRGSWTYVYLTRAFNPTRAKGTALPANTFYDYKQFQVNYVSNNITKITYSLNSTVGQFFNGQSYSFGGSINLRLQPRAGITLAANYDRVELPKPYPTANIILISPKIDLTFSKSVFWSTLIQYSNQRDNLGINSRLQWRFAPLSDLFLVYNDNYYTQDFSERFRSINLKLSYWLNVSSIGK